MKKNNYKFSETLIRSTKVEIDISLIHTNSSIPLNRFIKIYKISNFWIGKFFIKRLIKKVFKYKINKKIIWDNEFWNKIRIDIYDSKISNRNNNLIDDVKMQMTPNRLKDVNKYKQLIDKEVDIGCPLYISSQSLNFLGGSIIEDNIYILDGSRRLTAYALSQVNPQFLVINIDK